MLNRASSSLSSDFLLFSSLIKVLLTSGEWVHKWRLCQSWWGDHLLGFADLRVRFRKLQSDGLGQVGIEPHSLLQKNWCETLVLVLHSWLGQGGKRDVELRNLLFPALIVGQVKLTGGRKGAKSCLFWLVWPLRQVSATIWAARLFFVRRQLLQEAPCLLPWVA